MAEIDVAVARDVVAAGQIVVDLDDVGPGEPVGVEEVAEVAPQVLGLAGEVVRDRAVAGDRSIPDDFAGQAENLWRNLGDLLDADGLAWSDVVKVNHYLTSRDDIASYRDIYLRHLGDAAPAATLVIVEALASPAFKLEVEIVAA